MPGEMAKIRLFLYTYNSEEDGNTKLKYPFKIYVDGRLVFDRILIQSIKDDSEPIINVSTGKYHTITVELKGTDVIKKTEQIFNKNTVLAVFCDLKAKDLIVKTLQDKIKIKIDFLKESYFQLGDSFKIFIDDELVFDKISFGRNLNNGIQQPPPRLTLELKEGMHSISLKSRKNILIGKIEQIFKESGTLHVLYNQNDNENGKKGLILNFD
ncbi:hypothetical protein KAU39_06460 [bacterium]|nr:hypothetical protein [bacterium]